MTVKRMHYFDQQFLVEKDFTDEQSYHRDMRLRHARVLHAPGVAEGLVVKRSGNKQVTVSAGTAVDRKGQELVLEADATVDVTLAGTLFVTLTFGFEETDPSASAGAPGNTRITEQPILAIELKPSSDDSVILGGFATTAPDGFVPGNNGDVLDGGVRQIATARIAPGAVARAQLDPNLSAKIDAALVSVDGVKSPGGNIDLVPGGTVVITPDVVNKRIMIGEAHSSIVGNPHGTTAAMLNAITSIGGIANPGGGVGIARTNAITVAADAINKQIVIGETHSTFQGNPHGTTAAMLNALTSVGGIANPGAGVGIVPANSITVGADDPNKRVVIGETHSARQGNVHSLTAADLVAIGAVVSNQYEWRLSTATSVVFNQNPNANPPLSDQNGATKTMLLSFQPKFVVVFCGCYAALSGRACATSSVGFLDARNGLQASTMMTFTRSGATEWVSGNWAGYAGHASAAGWLDYTVSPAQGEYWYIRFTTAPAPNVGLVATLTRSVAVASPGGPLAGNVFMNAYLLCFGTS